MELPGRTRILTGASRSNKNFDDIFSRLDRMHERDGRTNRQTDTGRQQRPRLRIASCGKNCTLGTKTNTQRRKSTTLNKWLWPWSCTSLHHYVATCRSLKVAGQVLVLDLCGSSSSSCIGVPVVVVLESSVFVLSLPLWVQTLLTSLGYTIKQSTNGQVQCAGVKLSRIRPDLRSGTCVLGSGT